ncbi:MAG: DUF2948 family protein [Pseudomonadota bacterium]
MTDDARFEDGAERPLRLRAFDVEDLQVVSSVTQDSIFPISEMTWRRRERRFAILLNRFRWEDAAVAEQRRTPYERVQSVLTIEDVLHVATQGIDRSESETVLSLLSIAFTPGDDGTGRLTLTLAGDGAIGIDVEALEVTLADVTRPYLARSDKAPTHPD